MDDQPRAQQTGRFTFDPGTGRWDWDDEVYRIHGLEPGSVNPTTDFVLASKHPDDRARVAALIDRVSITAEPFSIAYRVVAGDGIERRVLLVGESDVCDDGAPTLIQGYYIDLTDDFLNDREQSVQEALAASAESRAVIEQAKGVLMLAYELNADQAFSMLRWWSRNHNVKVRDLAQKLIESAAEDGGLSTADLRSRFDMWMHDATETI